MPKFCLIGIIPTPIPSCRAHSHETWEIVLYTLGRGVATIGKQDFPFSPGTIICMPPRIPHLENSEAGYTNICIQTDEYPQTGRVPVFFDSPDRSFYHLAMLLHTEFHLKRPNWKLITQDLFDILLLYLNRWEDKEPQHPLVENLKNTIVANLANAEFDMGSSIAALPISSDHLRKVFCKSTGCTPLDFLTKLRMDEARHLLKIGGFSVKEVAVRVGFSDPYYFSRLFRKITGYCPTEFSERGLN